DALRWQGLVEKSAQEAENPAEVIAAGSELLQHMRRICAPGRCRHRSLTEYFGQDYGPETEGGCQACDVCLEECEALEDGTIAAQMILSCVARVQERFGLTHVVDVLRGAGTDRIRSLGHEQLSTYGLLKDTPKNVVTQKVYQLIDQELLQRTDGEYPILRLNAASWEVLRGQHKVWLIPIRERKVKKTAIERKSWEGVDRELFQSLRKLRTRLARERSVPPYVIFSDASLRDMAARRPRSEVEFLQVHGVGEKRLADFGGLFLTEINSHPHETDRETNG
ncbi:MAG: RQC domain-containing protein, partial [Planctomycetota bacterium]